MSELDPGQNETGRGDLPPNEYSYLTDHPDAVEDPNKARVMAEASKGAEEGVVEARRATLEAANNIGNSDFRSAENRGAGHEARVQAGKAEEAALTADKQAAEAADKYNRVTDKR